jgi:hypothetical protein
MFVQPIDYFLVVWFALAALGGVGSVQKQCRTGSDEVGLHPRHRSTWVLLACSFISSQIRSRSLARMNNLRRPSGSRE